MMFFASLKMMLLVPLAMMRCLPQNISEATSFPKETSLAQTTSFAAGKHHSKNAPLSVNKRAFFVGAGGLGSTVCFAYLWLVDRCFATVPDFTALIKKQYPVLFFLTSDPLGFDPQQTKIERKHNLSVAFPLYCLKVTKRSRVEVRVSKSTPHYLSTQIRMFSGVIIPFTNTSGENKFPSLY